MTIYDKALNGCPSSRRMSLIESKKFLLFAKVAVETPVNLTSEQESLLQQFEDLVGAGGERHNPRAGGWLETVKRFFEKISQ